METETADETQIDHERPALDPSDARPAKRQRVSAPLAITAPACPGPTWFTKLFTFLQYRQHKNDPSWTPSSKSPSEEERTLARWIHNQNKNRYQLRTGKSCCAVTKSQIEILLNVKDFPFVKSLQETRNEYIAQLKEFKEKHGHCHVPVNTKLGRWVQQQRNRYKANKVPPQLVTQLEEIGLEWSYFDKMYNQLLAFKQVHGHVNVSRDGEHDQLANWMGAQRARRKAGKLPDETITKLNSIGFNWGKQPSSQKGKEKGMKLDVFEKNYAKLAAYAKEHGHCNIPAREPLGTIVHTWRNRYREGKLPPWAITKLEDIGFTWSEWDTMYKRLVEHHEQYGNFNAYNIDSKLARWVATQRSSYRAGTIDKERMNKLNAIQFIWNMGDGKTVEERNKEFIQELKEYKAEHGHVRVAASCPLGGWIYRMRIKYKDGTLDEALKSQLQEIGLEWTHVREAHWDEMYEKLKEFYEQHGHSNVNTTSDEYDKPFRVWIAKQRRYYQDREKYPLYMTEEKIAKLEQLDFQWNRILTGNYEGHLKMIEKLKEYKDKRGHCNVAVSSGPLGSWVKRIRKKYRGGTLDGEIEAKLNEIGFEWTHTNNYNEVCWENMYKQLKSYIEKHGQCKSIKLVDEGDDILARWVQKQRSNYRRFPWRISDVRIAKLEELGFDWDPTGTEARVKSHSERAEAHLKKLRAIKEAKLAMGGGKGGVAS